MEVRTMNRDMIRQALVVVATLAVITVNVLANALPLNGQNTGEISDRFDILFVPAGYVFSIWSLIYLGLIAYSIFQASPGQRENPRLRRIGYLYVLSSIANIVWLFLWHYEVFTLTLVAMVTILLSLILIYLRLDNRRHHRQHIPGLVLHQRQRLVVAPRGLDADPPGRRDRACHGRELEPERLRLLPGPGVGLHRHRGGTGRQPARLDIGLCCSCADTRDAGRIPGADSTASRARLSGGLRHRSNGTRAGPRVYLRSSLRSAVSSSAVTPEGLENPRGPTG
jgi:hypothetical protein